MQRVRNFVLALPLIEHLLLADFVVSNFSAITGQLFPADFEYLKSLKEIFWRSAS